MVETTGLRFAPSLLSVMVSAFEGRAEGINFEPRLIYIQVERETEEREKDREGGGGIEGKKEKHFLTAVLFRLSFLCVPSPTHVLFLFSLSLKPHSPWERTSNLRVSTRKCVSVFGAEEKMVFSLFLFFSLTLKKKSPLQKPKQQTTARSHLHRPDGCVPLLSEGCFVPREKEGTRSQREKGELFVGWGKNLRRICARFLARCPSLPPSPTLTSFLSRFQNKPPLSKVRISSPRASTCSLSSTP